MASDTFSELEILKIAILMEDEGASFYTNGAKHTTGKIKDFLLFAAGQEFVHKEKFTKLYNYLLDKSEEGNDYLFDSDVTAYLKALIENSVFDKRLNAEDAFKDLPSALEYALKSEKLTVEVYTKLYEGIRNSEAKEVLSALIKEEKSHIDYFTELIEEIV